MKKVIFLSAALSGAGWAAAAQEACTSYPAGTPEHVCTCTGAETGSVWGSGPYTADSNICAAARHAGVMGTAGGTVVAFNHPGQPSYVGTTANDVQTSNWGSYGSSFDFRQVIGDLAACGVLPQGADSHTCLCTGNETGAVWGSGPYTADSDLCVAARHAGVIGAQGGRITALRAGGLASYTGTAANGVTTSNWGSYGSSVVITRN